MTALPAVIPTFDGKPRGELLPLLRKAAETLNAHFGRVDPTWGEVNRFRRGTIDEGASGGPDTLRAIESTISPGADGKFEANKGDTLFYFVEWDKDGKVSAESIHQFGSATLDALRLTQLLNKYRTPSDARSIIELLITVVPLVTLWISAWLAFSLGHVWALPLLPCRPRASSYAYL